MQSDDGEDVEPPPRGIVEDSWVNAPRRGGRTSTALRSPTPRTIRAASTENGAVYWFPQATCRRGTSGPVAIRFDASGRRFDVCRERRAEKAA